MKVWCVFIEGVGGCYELKGIFNSDVKAERFAVEFEEGGVEYFVEPMWVK